MLLNTRFLGLMLCLGMLVGCANEAPKPQSTNSPEVATPEEMTEIVVLSVEDQALADAQKICPVGGEELGSMGTPVKVMVGDRAVFLCCEGCRGPLLKDPEKFLAKLDAAAAPPADQPEEAPPEPPADTPAAPAEEPATPAEPPAPPEPAESETPAAEAPAAETPAPEAEAPEAETPAPAAEEAPGEDAPAAKEAPAN